jgi:hypothetical protein
MGRVMKIPKTIDEQQAEMFMAFAKKKLQNKINSSKKKLKNLF